MNLDEARDKSSENRFASSKFISHERKKNKTLIPYIYNIFQQKTFFSKSPRQKTFEIPHFNEYFDIFWRNLMTSQWRRSGFAR